MPTEKIESSTADSLSKETPPLTIIEFFDFGCSHCKNAAQVVSNLKEKYGDKVNIEIKHFPLRPATFLAAEAAECARNQNQFKAFHDAIFSPENFGKNTAGNLKAIAVNLNLNTDQFTACLESESTKDRVMKDKLLAKKYNVSSTPYFLIPEEDIEIPGFFPEPLFIDLIDKLLKS